MSASPAAPQATPANPAGFGDVDFLVERFRAHPDAAALAWMDDVLTYGALASAVTRDVALLRAIRLADGSPLRAGVPVVLLGDFSTRSVPMLLALIAVKAVVVPLTPTSFASLEPMLPQVAPQLVVDLRDAEGTDGAPRFEQRPAAAPNPLYRTLIDRDTSGLVLFTSGSTGRPKAVVHDFSRLLTKFRNARPGLVTLNFLLFDHWGGLNTLLGCLASGTVVVFPEARTPREVAELVQRHRVELLPATPSFLNMLLLSHAERAFDLSSLRMITYGAEPMPAATLRSVRERFPEVELRQTYGMIELGVLRAKSRSSDSLWVRLGGEGYDLRVRDGILQIKAESAMLGYIDAPSPFTDDGYLVTGDRVEQDGEWLRILGRDSDIINVGGQKVYPSEVESVVLEVPEVVDVVVFGEANVLTGKIVCADVVGDGSLPDRALKSKVRRHCGSRLQPFMVPVRVNVLEQGIQTARFKRRRDR